jgi:hypothetical protein
MDRNHPAGRRAMKAPHRTRLPQAEGREGMTTREQWLALAERCKTIEAPT